MSKQTILALVASDKHSGPGRVALHHARLLREAGHRVLFCCQSGGALQTAAEGAAVWHESGLVLPTKGQVWSLLLDLLRLRRLVRREGVKLVFCHRSADHLSAGLSVGGRVPLARFVHNVEVYDAQTRPLGRLGRWLLRRRWTRAVLLPSPVQVGAVAWDVYGHCNTEPEEPLDGAISAMPCVGPNKQGLYFVPGGVDTLHYTPDRGGVGIREELGISDQHVIIGFVSRLKRGRGHSLFLQAFAKAAAAEDSLRALVIGGGAKKEQEAVRSEAAGLGVADRVAFFDPGIRFESALAAVDVGCLLHPGSAGTAQAALELMSMARPMVVLGRGVLAHLSDVAEVIPVAGSEAAPGEPTDAEAQGLADAFVRLAQDPELRLDKGLAGRERMELEFSRTVLQRQLLDLCARLITPL